jgi:CHAT domain
VSTDFEVEILPGGVDGNLLFTLTASDPGLSLNHRQFMRNASFTLSAGDIKDLRGGSPPAPLVMKIATEVSNWVIGSDMFGFLNAPVNGQAPIRIIFKVDRTLLDKLADLPFELLRVENEWLLMRPAVSAIVHQLPFTGIAKQPNQSLPLKVLVVRASPSGLPVKVPPAAPICNQIIKLANELGPNLIQLDLLSREVEVGSLEPEKSWEEFEAAHLPELVINAGDSFEERERKGKLKWKELRQYLLDRRITELAPGTWEQCVERLNKSDYHVLVYLGHGNHMELIKGQGKTGVLQFEKPGGKSIQPVTSSQLNKVLQNMKVPVPVVLLTGCLTAAEFDALPQENKDSLRDWALGSQGVAQSLVDSPTGVQCAVGMRYQIETNAAFNFLRAFFESLLQKAPGNVEVAVRAGRSTLFSIGGEFPPSWSAPVIFRTRGEEPMLRFIADVPKTYTLDREDLKAQDVRELMWNGLLQEPDSQVAQKFLAQTEQDIKTKAATQGVALVMPEIRKAAPDETITVPINIFGHLSVDLMKCKLAVIGAGASIQLLRSTQLLKDSGFRLKDMTEAGMTDISFSIERTSQANPLPQGAIIEAQLTLGPTIPAKYTINLDILETQPAQIVRSVNNVVLVLPA